MDRMAAHISSVLWETDPVLLCVMLGGLQPTAMLLQRFAFPLCLDYAHLGRYRARRGGSVRWRHRPAATLRDRVVLVVDDILDEGKTLAAVLEACRERGASRVWSAVLARKRLSHEPCVEADFVALEVPNRFVVGCGLDCDQYGRGGLALRALPEA